MQKNIWIIGSIVALVLVALGAWWQLGTEAAVEPYLFPIASEDTVSSWSYAGAYTGDSELEQKAHSEIERLEGLLGNKEDTFTDYELYVSIANNYGSLGDGRQEYEYLGRALAIDKEKTGLAWHNLGVLMTRLGAYHTARIAYDNMVKVQPHIINYHQARLAFLRSYVPEDTAAIAEAEAELEAIAGEYIFE